MIDIKILNSDTELKSFPITQTLKLSSTVELDTTSLNDHIILFRTIPEKGLVSLVEPYSYTVGYIKEKFSTVDLSFTQNKENNLGINDYYDLVNSIEPISMNRFLLVLDWLYMLGKINSDSKKGLILCI